MDDGGRRRANVELKARYPDRARALEVCEHLGARYVQTEVQTDTYFSLGAYRLKLRESSLGLHYLIWYARPSHPEARKSIYRLRPVPDPEAKRRILSQAMGIKRVVRKERILFLWEGVRIHVDRVEGLGGFLEFEAVVEGTMTERRGRERIAELRRAFEIPEEDLVAGSYSDLPADGIASSSPGASGLPGSSGSLP